MLHRMDVAAGAERAELKALLTRCRDVIAGELEGMIDCHRQIGQTDEQVLADNDHDEIANE